ncbi:hypothetical protein UCD39_05085 [Nitrospirillum sp. BR 11752]|nr:hypothetical protein [Nitrospirillum sp. BR 11752]
MTQRISILTWLSQLSIRLLISRRGNWLALIGSATVISGKRRRGRA